MSVSHNALTPSCSHQEHGGYVKALLSAAWLCGDCLRSWTASYITASTHQKGRSLTFPKTVCGCPLIWRGNNIKRLHTRACTHTHAHTHTTSTVILADVSTRSYNHARTHVDAHMHSRTYLLWCLYVNASDRYTTKNVWKWSCLFFLLPPSLVFGCCCNSFFLCYDWRACVCVCVNGRIRFQ